MVSRLFDQTSNECFGLYYGANNLEVRNTIGKWLCPKTVFALFVTLWTLKERTKLNESNVRDANYFAFLLQLQAIHLYADLIFSVFMYYKMQTMRYGRVILCMKVHEKVRGLLAILLVLLGLTYYSCMDLINVVVNDGFVSLAIVTIIYFYLLVQVLIGLSFIFKILVLSCKTLNSCRNADNTQQENQNVNAKESERVESQMQGHYDDGFQKVEKMGLIMDGQLTETTVADRADLEDLSRNRAPRNQFQYN